MTENQISEMFRLMNTASGKISNIETDVPGLKSDASDLKEGQARLEAGQERLKKERQITDRALDRLAGESIRVQARVDILKQHSN